MLIATSLGVLPVLALLRVHEIAHKNLFFFCKTEKNKQLAYVCAILLHFEQKHKSIKAIWEAFTKDRTKHLCTSWIE